MDRFIAHIRKSDGATQSVERHLANVGCITKHLAAKFGLSSLGLLIGLLHDLGKYSAAFQRRIGENDPEKVDHSTAGAQFLWRELAPKGQFESFLAQALSLCVASHHGGLIDCLAPDGIDQFGKRMNKNDAETCYQEVIANAPPELLKSIRAILNDKAVIKAARDAFKSIVTKLKYLNLGAEEHKARFHFEQGLLLRMLFSCLIDGDRTDTADFENPDQKRLRLLGNYLPWETLTQRLESKLATFTTESPINAIRRSISDACLDAASRSVGLFTLTVPTGGGKTLASLRFALNHARLSSSPSNVCDDRRRSIDHIIYVVPYTTIIDQNAQECREILEAGTPPGSVVLEHHSNLTPDECSEVSRLAAENWDAPIIYTTMVQFLETLFAGGTQSVRRMHQLANSIIIFDEIQALPIKMAHLFSNAISFLVKHCNASVVLCTATQPLLSEIDNVKGALDLAPSNEIIENVDELFQKLKRVEVGDQRRPKPWTSAEIAEYAITETEVTGSTLVIVNTKKTARLIYEECQRLRPGFKVFHLSTSMCPAHRMAVLKEIGTRIGERGMLPEFPEKTLCISTQLIEAGVDVDFATVIRALAGWDSAQQAAGRCNRHNRRGRLGKTYIINPADEDLTKLKEIQIAQRESDRVLREFAIDPQSFGGDLLSRKAMDRYFSYFFFNRRKCMDYPVKAEREDSLLNMLSSNSNAVEDFVRINKRRLDESTWLQSFKSAAALFTVIDSATKGVVVPYGKKGREVIADLSAADDPTEMKKLLREAQRYSVNVFQWELEKLQFDQAVREVQPYTGIYYLDERYYSENFGFSLEPVSGADFLYCG